MGQIPLRLACFVPEYPNAGQPHVHAEAAALGARGIATLVASHRPPPRGVEFAGGPALPVLHLPVDGPGTRTVLGRAGITHVHACGARFALRRVRPLARAIGATYSFSIQGSDLGADDALRPVEWRTLATDPAFVRAVVPSRFHLAALHGRGVPAGRALVIPPAVDLSSVRAFLRPAPTMLRRVLVVPPRDGGSGARIAVRAARRLHAAGVALEIDIVGAAGVDVGADPPPGVRLSPPRAGRDLQASLAEADLVVVAAASPADVDREDLVTVLAEALSLRRPVIAPACGALADLVWPGISGVLVPAADPAGLAQEVTRLARDPATLGRLARGGPLLAAAHDANLVAGRIVEQVLVPAGRQREAMGISADAPRVAVNP